MHTQIMLLIAQWAWWHNAEDIVCVHKRNASMHFCHAVDNKNKRLKQRTWTQQCKANEFSNMIAKCQLH